MEKGDAEYLLQLQQDGSSYYKVFFSNSTQEKKNHRIRGGALPQHEKRTICALCERWSWATASSCLDFRLTLPFILRPNSSWVLPCQRQRTVQAKSQVIPTCVSLLSQEVLTLEFLVGLIKTFSEFNCRLRTFYHILLPSVSPSTVTRSTSRTEALSKDFFLLPTHLSQVLLTRNLLPFQFSLGICFLETQTGILSLGKLLNFFLHLKTKW